MVHTGGKQPVTLVGAIDGFTLIPALPRVPALAAVWYFKFNDSDHRDPILL